MLQKLKPEELHQAISELDDETIKVLQYDWSIFAREKQMPPTKENWFFWLILAGRGFGKTRTGAETVRMFVESGNYKHIGLFGATAGDIRDIIIEGESGLLNVSPSWAKPYYEPSKRRLTWPNGAVATMISGEEPDRARGKQYDLVWCDELASWKYQDTFDQMLMGLRLGKDPKCIITTTPRPIKRIKELIEDEKCVVTTGSTFENIDNVAPAFIDLVVSKYQGTRIGRQELNAEILEDVAGSLWSHKQLDELRVDSLPEHIDRIVVAVDPAVTSNAKSDDTGIIVGLKAGEHFYIIDDLSCHLSPDAWAREAVNGAAKHDASAIIGEVNNGGDLVEQMIRMHDKSIKYKAVRASTGKLARAEPASALYEQGRVHHVGSFPELETEMCSMTLHGYKGEGSPDRLDALVWCLAELDQPEKTIMIGRA